MFLKDRNGNTFALTSTNMAGAVTEAQNLAGATEVFNDSAAPKFEKYTFTRRRKLSGVID